MNDLQQFIEVQKNLHDASLCILSQKSLDEVIGSFTNAGYIVLDKIINIKEKGKYIIVIDEDNFSEVYNFVCQYGSGQWTFSGDKWMNPDYENLSFVMVAEKNFIVELDQKNIPLLSKVGMSMEQ